MKTFSHRIWNWLACKLLPDAVVNNPFRKDFDEEASGEARAVWPIEQAKTDMRPLTPAAQLADSLLII